MTVNEFFEALANGAVWSAGVAFERTNPLPLDKYSVFASNAEAETYVSTNPVAYPGQVIAVVSDTEKSNVYYVNEAMELKPIGIIPVGEKGAIEVSPEGAITLNGFSTAQNSYLPRVKIAENGSRSLEWVPVSDVVEGDTNTQTFGDEKTIDTVKDTSLDKYTASLHGFSNAAEGQIAYKKGTEIAWKDEYKYDDAQVQANKEAIAQHAATIESHTSTLSTVEQNITNVAQNITKIETSLGITDESTTPTIGQDLTKAKEDISQLRTDVDALPTNDTVDSKISTAIGQIDHLKRKVLDSKEQLPAASAADLNTIYMVPRETKIEGSDSYIEYMSINNVWEIIGDTVVDLSGYATTSAMEAADAALDSKITNVTTTANNALPKSDFESFKTSNTKAIEAKANQADLELANQNIDKKLDSTTAASTYATQESLTKGLATKLNSSEISKYQTTEAAGTESKRLENLINDKAASSALSALQGTVETNTAAIESNDAEILALQQVGAEKNIINSADSNEFNIIDRNLSIKAIGQDKITGLAGALAGKVSAVDGQRLMTNDEGTKLTHITISEAGTSFDGKVEVANVNGLDTHITAQRDSLAGLISTTKEAKLDAIEENAQVNKIEAIQIEGAADTLAIVEGKKVILPIATTELPGLVKLSAEVGLNASNGLEIKSMNVNKLIQTEGDTLILNGGNAAK